MKLEQSERGGRRNFKVVLERKELTPEWRSQVGEIRNARKLKLVGRAIQIAGLGFAGSLPLVGDRSLGYATGGTFVAAGQGAANVAKRDLAEKHAGELPSLLKRRLIVGDPANNARILSVLENHTGDIYIRTWRQKLILSSKSRFPRYHAKVKAGAL
ncbi:MAG: hypothetical protein AABX01_02260 [Candidatus Micrarchaeota archaeon]